MTSGGGSAMVAKMRSTMLTIGRAPCQTLRTAYWHRTKASVFRGTADSNIKTPFSVELDFHAIACTRRNTTMMDRASTVQFYDPVWSDDKGLQEESLHGGRRGKSG